MSWHGDEGLIDDASSCDLQNLKKAVEVIGAASREALK